MLFSYNWFKDFVKGKLSSPQKLEKLLTAHVFEVENVEKKSGDWIFDIAVLPHRPDCMGHLGLAREIAAITKKAFKEPQKRALKVEKGKLAPLKVQVLGSGILRYSALLVQGINITKSPKWLKERLELLGMNSINTVVDITNYVMLEMGQPLHAFDYDKIKNHTMKIREAREGEEIVTLDDLLFQLPKGTLVIEDEKRLIDLAGIKGGKLSSIGEKTTNVVFQAATFDGERIYKTRKELGYSTPAADLYAHNLDPNLTIPALKRAAAMLKLLGGGKIVQVVDFFPKKRNSKVLVLPLSLLKDLLGIDIPQSVARKILERLGFQAQKKKGSLRVFVPPFRQDVNIPQDLVEEIGRISGYGEIQPTFPLAPLSLPEENQNLALEERLRDSLKEAGFTEAYNYSFIGEKDLSLLHYTKKEKAGLIELENPFSEELKYLKSTLLDNLLKAGAKNIPALGGKQLKIFEIGKTFEKHRELSLAGGIIVSPEKSRETTFFEAKGVIDFVLSRLGIGDVWYDDFQQTPEQGRVSLWHQKKSAEVKVGGKEIGFVGEISPAILSSLKIPGSLSAFELNLGELLSVVSEELSYKPIPRFPAVLRDIAVLVPRTTRVGEVMNIMHENAGPLLSDIDLFDMYEGEEIPEGKKNFAFHLIYQAEDRTLQAKEVDAIQTKITQALEENPDWEVRK